MDVQVVSADCVCVCLLKHGELIVSRGEELVEERRDIITLPAFPIVV